MHVKFHCCGTTLPYFFKSAYELFSPPSYSFTNMWPPSSKTPTKSCRASFPLIGKTTRHFGQKKINYLKFAPSKRVVFSLSCVKILSPETMSKAKYAAVIFRHFLRSGENRCVEKKSRSLTYIKLSFDIFVIKQANEMQITLMKD